MSRTTRMALSLLGGLLAVMVVAIFTLETLVRHAVERIGTAQLQVPVTLNRVSISLAAGRVTLDQLAVANPHGYQTPTAIAVKRVLVEIDWKTVVTSRLVFPEIVIEGPDVTVEGSPSDNNLETLRKRALRAPSGAQPDTHSTPSPDRAVVIRRLRILDAKVHLRLKTGSFETRADAIRLKPITLEHLGDPAHPLTTSDAVAKILGALTRESIGSLGKTAGDLLGKGAQEASKAIDQAVGGLKDLFSK